MGHLRVGIVGCGTAGPAVAVMLARQEHAVTVFDKAPVLNPIGAGLLLQPSGLAVLAEMGLREQIEAAGSLIGRMHATCPPPGGRSILDLSYSDLRPDLHGIGIRRGELLHALLGAARAAGVSIRTGEEVGSIRDRARESELVSSSGTSFGAFDLILVCDGARSGLVRSLGIPVRVRNYRWGALWFIGRRPLDPAAPHACTLEQVYRSTTDLIGALPSGPTGDGDESISIFFSARTDRFDAIRRGDLGAWKRRVAQLHPRAGEIAAQVGSADDLLPAAYREVVMPRWHAGRVAVLGDAAHALSPLLGMGANMGLMDAHTLAACISAHGVPAGLAAYSQARHDAVRAYQRICRWMNPFFQSGVAPLAWARDLAVPRLCRWPWSRRQALLTVAGVKTGVLTAGDLPSPFVPRVRAEPTFAKSVGGST